MFPFEIVVRHVLSLGFTLGYNLPFHTFENASTDHELIQTDFSIELATNLRLLRKHLNTLPEALQSRSTLHRPLRKQRDADASVVRSHDLYGAWHPAPANGDFRIPDDNLDRVWNFCRQEGMGKSFVESLSLESSSFQVGVVQPPFTDTT